MADVLYNVLDRFNITKRLLCITTDNAGNNGTMRKELEEPLNNLDINNDWSSESTKIPYLAHVSCDTTCRKGYIRCLRY